MTAKIDELREGDLYLIEQAKEMQELYAVYPNWREIVGAQEDNTPFRNWLLKQPRRYQKLVNTTLSAKKTIEAITKFQRSRFN